jgi:hypothetical protein
MKSKIYMFLLIVALSIAYVSAADFSLSLSSDLTKSVNSTTLIITNTGLNNITINLPTIVDISDGEGHTIVTNQGVSSGIHTISVGNVLNVPITYSISTSDLEDLALGDFSIPITVTSGNDSSTINLNFRSDYCLRGEKTDNSNSDNRRLEITSLKDASSDKDWEWKPGDEVEITIKVEFSSDDNDDDIDGVIEYGLYDSEDNEFLDLDESEIEFSVDEGEKDTETITFEVPVEDIEDSTSKYKFYVKVYEDGSEEDLCTSRADGDYFQDIEINKESYEVVLNKIELTSSVPCGENAEFNAIVSNTGSHDEDQVKVIVYNKELGINLEEEVLGLDEGETKDISFNFMIPKNAIEKSYTFSSYVYYKYSDTSEEYREISKVYTNTLKVEGSCSVAGESNARITAELSPETPEAIAGKQIAIKGTLMNTGSKEADYTLSVIGNSLWSDLASIEPRTLTVGAGESQDFDIILSINKDSVGEKEFTIRSISNGNLVDQKVAISITKSSSATNVFQPLVDNIKTNWLIYIIILVNLILIIAIIMVARRISRRRSVDSI